jgi:hypothetical protein
MTPEEKYKINKHKITENKTEILLRVKLLKYKLSTKVMNSDKIFTTGKQLKKLFAINSQTAQLLLTNYCKCFCTGKCRFVLQ